MRNDKMFRPKRNRSARDEIEKPSTVKTYIVKWELMMAGVSCHNKLIEGTFRVRSKDSKAKVKSRSRGMVFNTLGVLGVSNIDTETFKVKITHV